MGIHETIHNTYGICLWTLLAFVVLAIMIVIAGIHLYKQNRRDSQNEERREQYAAEMTEYNRQLKEGR